VRTALFPSPSGKGRGEGPIEPGRVHAGTTLPYAHVKSALGVIGFGSLQVGGGILTEIGFEKILGLG
jgi:hypothetical protein